MRTLSGFFQKMTAIRWVIGLNPNWLLGNFLIAWSLIYLVSGWHIIASYSFGKEDTALCLNALWLAGNGYSPISQAYAGYSVHVWLGNHFMPAGLPDFLVVDGVS